MKNNKNPKKIVATKKTVNELKRMMEESKKRMAERMPPKETLEWMRKKAEETDEMNGGTLDKSTFMLGMMAMWSYMNKKAKENGTNT